MPVPGLLGQGEDWHSFRVAVQQDLMRPKSALFYIKELNESAEELCAKVAANLDANSDAVNFNATLQRFALEATGIMFIGTRLGCLKDNPESLQFIRGGNFLVLVNVKSWVKEQTWLLIGCLKTKNQSGATLAL